MRPTNCGFRPGHDGVANGQVSCRCDVLLASVSAITAAYQFDDVKITPGYVQEGGPPLWIAAMSEAGALRAARYNTNFLPQGVKAESYDPWVKALTDSGRDPGNYRIGIIRSILVTDDKANEWEPVRASERYRMQLYRRFSRKAVKATGVRESRCRRHGLLAMRIVRGGLKHFVRTFGITDIVYGGAAGFASWRYERIADVCLPGLTLG